MHSLWPLRVDPGFSFPQDEFPLDDTDALEALTAYDDNDQWIDRGWLRTEAGVSSYEFHAPAEIIVGDQDADYWAASMVQQVNFVRRYSLKGELVEDLEVSDINRNTVLNGWTAQGVPCEAFWEKGREKSILRLKPTPDDSYILAVSWYQSRPIPYYFTAQDEADDNYTHVFMQQYEEAVQAAACLYAAEYFSEAPAIEYWTTKLTGAPPKAGNKLDDATGGLIGLIKKDSARRRRQEVNEIPMYRSSKEAVRRGRGSRVYRRGFYYD